MRIEYKLIQLKFYSIYKQITSKIIAKYRNYKSAKPFFFLLFFCFYPQAFNNRFNQLNHFQYAQSKSPTIDYLLIYCLIVIASNFDDLVFL